MTDLLALADEIVALKEPSLEMDARVWVALHDGLSVFKVSAWYGHAQVKGPDESVYDPPPLTASIDAAYALLRETMPGWQCDMLFRTPSNANAGVMPPNGALGGYYHGQAPTLPLAICAAVVRAVAASKAER